MPEIQVKDKLITLEELGTAINAKAGVTSVNNQTGAVSVTPANIGAVAKSGDTMTGLLTFSNSSSQNGSVRIWADNEGGNIEIKSPNGQFYQIDTVNNSELRLFTFNSNGNFKSIGFNSETGAISATGGFNGNATNVSGIVAIDHGGTGATDAAEARTNLGITPANIGAVSLSQMLYVGTLSYIDITPGYTGGGEQFFKAALKYIAEHFNNAGMFVGIMAPNSRGPFIGNIYDVNDRDSSTGLPKHSTFIFHNLKGHVESFGTDNYTFYYRSYYNDQDVIPLANGGTGGTDAAAARTNLGIHYKDVTIPEGANYKDTDLSVHSYDIISVLVIDLYSSACDIGGVHPLNGLWRICLNSAVEVGAATVRILYIDK